MICRAGWVSQGLVQVHLEAGALPVDDPPLEPLVEWERRQLLGLGLLGRLGAHPGEQVEEPAQGVVADRAVLGVLAAVVDQVAGDRQLLLADPGDRQDLARVHDGRVQSGLDALVEEHRVQHLPGRGVQAEGDVRQAQGGLDVGMCVLDPADRLDGLDAVAAGLLLAGGDREREAVDEDVLRGDAVVVAQVGDEAVGDAQLPVGSARLAVLVDGQGDDPSPVLLDQRDDLGEPRAGAVPVLVVDRVHDRATAEHLQPGLEDGRLGGVQDDRQGRGRGQPAGQLAHVVDPVAAHVVDAQVEQVRAVADLLAGDLDAGLPVPGQHRLAEGLGPVGVRPLPDGQVGGVLPEGHRLVQGRRGRLVDVLARADLASAHPLDDGTQVLGGGTAAPADQRQPVVAREVVVRGGQLGGGQRVVGAVGGEHGQPRVGHRRDADPCVAGQVAKVLAHLGRAGGAVQPDHVDAQRLEGGQGRADLGAEQHGAGGLDRHLGDQGDVRPPGGGHRPAGTDERGLGLQEVLSRLDQDRVDPALQKPRHLLGVGVTQVDEGGVAQGGQLGARPDRAQHPAGPVRRGVAVGHLAGDPGTR